MLITKPGEFSDEFHWNFVILDLTLVSEALCS